ncbi:ROK family protein [Halalkalibacter krulwichiae]|uniref:Glucokinase n=1 Tax=Halalkalibacter krulwichiae TaxID=199441 RepID=A0A1X9MB82_9BACI|nr:ROK family protein [Halalkalibacter krulwichiae]ARK29850.1 Glucokinase [Halalkalibacter krulwichiae]
MNFAAIDIGGTTIKYALVTEHGEISEKAAVPTPKTGKKAMVDQLVEICKRLDARKKIDAVAISSAGQINSQTGEVIFATDAIPEYAGLNIIEELESRLNKPVTVENDVHCAALGEYWVGAAKGNDNFLCLTFGTGIGGAVVNNGLIYHGSTYSAAEFGHITLYPNGLSCVCGDHGCLEMYASSLALEKRIMDLTGRTQETLPIFFEEARSGNIVIEGVIDSWVEDIAAGLKTLIHSFNPKQIVIGGGISAQGEYLISKIQKSTYARIMPSFSKQLTIDMAQKTNDANLLGAVYHSLKVVFP